MDRLSEVRPARSPAEIYDELFVPALFRQWGSLLPELAGISPGQRVLDVACGTGALTNGVAERVGREGSVVGLDPNRQMLEVARRKAGPAEWIEGRAEDLPFRDASFDAVVSQFGFMFFEDRPRSLREMMRVLRPGGRLAVAVCDALEHSPGYAVIAALLVELFGTKVADAFRAPFALGDRPLLLGLCAEAGIAGAGVQRRDGVVRFGSLDDLLGAERACVWTLGGLLDDAAFALLRARARAPLSPYTAPDGAVAFTMPVLVITAQKS